MSLDRLDTRYLLLDTRYLLSDRSCIRIGRVGHTIKPRVDLTGTHYCICALASKITLGLTKAYSLKNNSRRLLLKMMRNEALKIGPYKPKNTEKRTNPSTSN